MKAVAPRTGFADQELSFKALERLLSTLSLARNGDFSVRMAADGDGMEREVADTVNELIAMLADFTKELERVSEAVVQGELRARLPLDKANGGWGQQLRAVNNIVVVFGKHVAELRRVVKAVHTGDMSRPVTVGPEATHRGGELARTAEDINLMIAHLQHVTSEITRVFAEVGLDGRLNSQCHISDASGSWGLLVGSVNAASASLSEQVQDLCTTAQSLAAGNLSARASVTSRGDLQTLKLGLNGAADGLAALCVELRRVAQDIVKDGKLASELRHPDPRGEWQSAQQAVNHMLGTIASAWRSALAQAERVLDGDYTKSTQVEVSGELGAPARVLQEVADQQARTQACLQALIEGRFNEVRAASGSERDLALVQLGLRLKREWFRSVRAGIYEAREQSAGGPRYADAVLATIAQSVNAAAGAYYVVGEDQSIVRVVNLGCDAPASEAPQRVGEGLLGKVARDGTPLLLEQLEQQGLRVRTGLLEITPRAALVFPIKNESRVTALIELLFVGNGAVPALELLDYLARDLANGSTTEVAKLKPAGDSPDVRELQEELVIANARLQQMAVELQQRDHALRTTMSQPTHSKSDS
jgi:HAMP domain-containing protein